MSRPTRSANFFVRLWREFLEPIVFAVVITQFVATLVGVDGVSMMPNLRNHERVLVPKYETWLHKIGVGNFQRGDILIFKPPAVAETRSFLGLWTFRPFLIKRLIGLPGDTIRIDGGEVSVNGRKLNGGFTTTYWQSQGCWDTQSEIANNAQVANPAGIEQTQKTFTVPAGQYFMMGDNRTAGGSEDSRLFGPIPLRDIAGRAAVVIWPILRKANAQYPCGAISAENGVTFSGPNQLNWRLLSRPPAFQKLKTELSAK